MILTKLGGPGAPSLALRFLETHASGNRDEWQMLADKAARWLATVNAAPPGGKSWLDLAASLSI